MRRSIGPARWTTAILAIAVACSRLGVNPVLGDWEIDRDQTNKGALIAAEVTELAEISFRSNAIAARDVEIPVTYEVERETVRAIRGDGRGEHRIELLPDDRIRVELPIGVTAVYRRTGS